MSGGELIVLSVCLFLTFAIWGGWGWVSFSQRSLRAPAVVDWVPRIAGVTSVVLIVAVLANFASHDVRGDGVYMGFYTVIGLAVTGLALVALDRLGLSVRDDVIERKNPAAVAACAGACIGIAAAYAGANIGDGPGWWVVIFSSGLSIGTVLVGWVIVDRVAEVGEAIVVERDLGKGIRMGGWFVATGVIAGRAAAGDWVDASSTASDFASSAVGALVLIVLAAGLERMLRARGTDDGHAAANGSLGAAVWVALATGWLVWLGRW